MKKPELLAPAGNMEKLKMALIYGADAVYLGGKEFGLRAFSDNFELDEMREAFVFAHQMGKRVYVTVNIFPHNEDLPPLPDYIAALANAGADGIIVADPGVFRLARQAAPDLPVHISTQANSTNWSTVAFWQELGVKRVVLAREISLADVREISSRTNIELEVFIHGAMCISQSGRCLLSNYFTGRDANRGQCTQACRWKYALVEETRPGQYFPVAEDDRGTYILNSRDLCLVNYLPELCGAGLDSFKIEGRMKSVHYVATVVKVYRAAIDAYFHDPKHFTVRDEWREELDKISHRAYTTGFYFGHTTESDQVYSSSSYFQSHDFVGLVRAYDSVAGIMTVEQRNNMKVGETVEIFQPDGPTFRQTIEWMKDEAGQIIEVAPHPQQIITMPVLKPVAPFAMLRREVGIPNA